MKINLISIFILVLSGLSNMDFSPRLDKTYTNKHFSLRYPSSWQIVQEDNQATKSAIISLQIMEKRKNDVDFCPNINIIVSNKKWEEPTSFIAKQVSESYKNSMTKYKEIRVIEATVGNCCGSVLQYSYTIQGYYLRGDQYILKKEDNTTFIITVTTDGNKYQEQMKVISEILESIEIK